MIYLILGMVLGRRRSRSLLRFRSDLVDAEGRMLLMLIYDYGILCILLSDPMFDILGATRFYRRLDGEKTTPWDCIRDVGFSFTTMKALGRLFTLFSGHNLRPRYQKEGALLGIMSQRA
jgi:hypothetical protein